MAQIIQADSSIVAAIINSVGYLRARRGVEQLSEIYGLRVADMPMAIQAMTTQSSIRAAVRPEYINTITGEYHGLRGGEPFYEVWHGVGSLATQEGLEGAFRNLPTDALAWLESLEGALKLSLGNFRAFGFMTIDANEWASVGRGEYLGQDVARIHIDDVKRGDVPKAGIPYTVFVRADGDNFAINGLLNYDAFMKNDGVLMVTGSEDGRDALGKILFGSKDDGGEGWELVGSRRKVKRVGFENTPRGRLMFLSNHNYGLLGNGGTGAFGRFLAVNGEMFNIGYQ